MGQPHATPAPPDALPWAMFDEPVEAVPWPTLEQFADAAAASDAVLGRLLDWFERSWEDDAAFEQRRSGMVLAPAAVALAGSRLPADRQADIGRRWCGYLDACGRVDNDFHAELLQAAAKQFGPGMLLAVAEHLETAVARKVDPMASGWFYIWSIAEALASRADDADEGRRRVDALAMGMVEAVLADGASVEDVEQAVWYLQESRPDFLRDRIDPLVARAKAHTRKGSSWEASTALVEFKAVARQLRGVAPDRPDRDLVAWRQSVESHLAWLNDERSETEEQSSLDGLSAPSGVSRVIDDQPWDEPPVQPIERTAPRIGRNDPCPCGSGRKYKKCCMPRE